MYAYLKNKKHIFWLILVAVLICIVVTGWFLTVSKSKLTAADFVGTWEFLKSVTDTYESDRAVEAMRGQTEYEIVFREDGTGTVTVAYGSESWETPITFSVSRNGLLVRRDGENSKWVEYIYDPEEGTLHALTGEGEGNRWVDYFVRKGTVTYPAVQLTVDQIAGQWKSDGLPVTKGRSPSLSGTLSLDRAGRASLHLYGDEGTEMTASGTYSVDGSLLRFEPEEVSEPLKYHPWYPKDGLYDLGMTSIYPMNETTATASYDPKNDTIRFYQWDFGVLTFYRERPVMPWYEEYDFEEKGPTGPVSAVVPSFPNVTFRCETHGIEELIRAEEGGRERTLLTGMPILNAFFVDVTGDGKPELCATVMFGSGICDEHVIVYDYANKQSYALWQRMDYDYRLYYENGALFVEKNSYSVHEQMDVGVLVMSDGVPVYLSQRDGSCTPLFRQLHESELYGEWLVREERDANGNTVDTPFLKLWGSYAFLPDGIMRCGDPAINAYEVYDNSVHLFRDDASSDLIRGHYDREKDALELKYDTPDGTVDAVLTHADAGTMPEENCLSEEQALTYLQNLPVEFVDGSPYGCDLVFFLDGFGECINVGDDHAADYASLQFQLSDKRSDRIVYNKILRVGQQDFYLGNVTVYARKGNLTYYNDWERSHPSADAALFVPVDPSMIARNRACVERAGVIRSFDAEKREVTVSLASLSEPDDGYPAEVLYDTVQEEELTLRVTEDTFLSLITDFEYLVRPVRFFRYLEENRYYLHSGDDYDDWGIGFWIGSDDGETLLYLCEVYEE